MFEINRVAGLEARLLKVIGRIQRVGFRRYALDLAQELGLAGYAKNLPDGSVQVLVQGKREPLSRFIELIKSPPLGLVREVRIEKVPVDTSIKEFRIVYGELEEELQEGFGVMQAAFMQYWGEFRSYRDEFREFARRTDENFRLLMEKYGEISEKLAEILETLIRESNETRRMLNESLRALREALERLSK